MKNDTDLKNILPLVTPIKCSMSTDSHLLSILQTFEAGYKWIMSHFILWCGIDNSDGREFEYVYIFPYRSYYMNWKECELLDYETDDESNIYNDGDIVKYLKNRIDDGWYCHMHFDQHQIGKTKTNHYQHHSLVYGYDDSAKEFYFADHFDNGKYDLLTCSYENTARAFNDIFTYGLAEFENGHEAQFLKINDFKEDIDYKKEILCAFKDMYDSSPTRYINEIKHHMIPSDFAHTYGLKLYDCYIKYFSDLLKGETDHIDNRLITNIKDHKILMLKRLEYFIKIGILEESEQVSDIIADYEQILRDSKIILNQYMKFQMTRYLSKIEKMPEYLNRIYSLEKNAIKMLIELLS